MGATHIISGSDDKTTRMWDEATGSDMQSSAILSGGTLLGAARCLVPRYHLWILRQDESVRMWDAETGSAVGKPLEEHTDSVPSVASARGDKY